MATSSVILTADGAIVVYDQSAAVQAYNVSQDPLQSVDNLDAVLSNIPAIASRIAAESPDLSMDKIFGAAIGIAVTIDNEVDWVNRRELSNMSLDRALSYIHDVYGYAPGSDQRVNSKRLWHTLGNKDLRRSISGDGYRFRGGGWIQLTGRWNYEHYVIPLMLNAPIKLSQSWRPSTKEIIRRVISQWRGDVDRITNFISDADLTGILSDPSFSMDASFRFLLTKATRGRLAHKASGVLESAQVILLRIGSYRGSRTPHKKGAPTPSLDDMTIRCEKVINALTCAIDNKLITKRKTV
jgi:hypothetical protein